MNRRAVGSALVAFALALALLVVSLLVSGSTQADPANPASGIAGAKSSQPRQPDGTWVDIAPFPSVSVPPTPGTNPLRLKRASAAAFPANQKLYVLGGRHGIDGEDTTMRSIYEYTPGNPGTWALKAAQLDQSAVGSRFTANMAVAVLTGIVGGPMIYAISGTSIDSIPTTTVRIYNPIADTVSTLPSDPWPAIPARVPGGWAVENNKLYLFGGFSAIGSGSVFTETWRFDPTAPMGTKWTRMADMNLGRAFIAGATLDGMIYAIGGDTWNAGSRTLVPVTSVERYFPVANTWTTISSLPTARGDLGAWAYDTGTSYEISGKIAVAGGVFPTPDATGYLYNPLTNSWSTFPNMVHATRNYGYAQLNGFLYAFGGYDYTNSLPAGANFNQRYDATTLQSTATPVPTATSAAPTATPTQGCLLPDYQMTTSIGADIVPGASPVPGSTCNSCVVTISLPFPYTLYDQTFTSVNASNKGNLQFLSSNTSGANTCLPTATLNYTILPYWDNLNTNINDNMGIFTSVSGVAPNRIFNIEWRTGYEANDVRPNFEVRLYEGQPKFEFVYGATSGGGSATIGVQRGTGAQFTQYSCNTGTIIPGRKVVFDRRICLSER